MHMTILITAHLLASGCYFYSGLLGTEGRNGNEEQHICYRDIVIGFSYALLTIGCFVPA